MNSLTQISSPPISAGLTSQADPYFSVSNLHVSFGDTHVVQSLSMSLNKGEIGCLLGFSGCGKTTALRAIAGLETPQQGVINLDSCTLTAVGNQKEFSHETQIQVMPAKRGMGMVFQDYALFNHLSVSENIGFGLYRLSKQDKEARIQEMLELVELSGHAHKTINELSGGQQQRVALARALAPNPKLLLMDEPFSNLDMILRESLAAKVRDILKRTDTTAILVTHDQHEAFAIADKVGVMHQGKLAQWATADELYHQPSTPFVAEFVGEGAMINGVIEQGVVKTALGDIKLNPDPIHPNDRNRQTYPQQQRSCYLTDGKTIKVLVRPDDIVHDDASPQQATVVGRVFRGASYLYRLRLANGEEVLSLTPSHHDHPIGSKLGYRPILAHVVLFCGDDLDATTWHKI